MKAIGKNIVITPTKEVEAKTKGGLLLAEVNRTDVRYRMAKVIAIGTDVIGVKEKDNIYYDRHAGFGIELNDEQFKVIKEGDVVIVL